MIKQKFSFNIGLIASCHVISFAGRQMSYWICCNSCFVSPSSNRKLAVTTCGHVVCHVCYQKGRIRFNWLWKPYDTGIMMMNWQSIHTQVSHLAALSGESTIRQRHLLEAFGYCRCGHHQQIMTRSYLNIYKIPQTRPNHTTMGLILSKKKTVL